MFINKHDNILLVSFIIMLASLFQANHFKEANMMNGDRKLPNQTMNMIHLSNRMQLHGVT